MRATLLRVTKTNVSKTNGEVLNDTMTTITLVRTKRDGSRSIDSYRKSRYQIIYDRR